jgi:thiol-disulfide isomerase/thioredoxin
MTTKLTTAIVFISLLISCHPSQEKIDFETFSKRFSDIQQKYKQKTKQVRSQDEYQALIKEKNKELEKLLGAAESVSTSHERDILTAKIYLQLKRFNEAEQLINPLLTQKSKFSSQIKMARVQILISLDKSTDALKVFREIEPRLKRDHDFFSASLFFALKAKETEVREQYSAKLLESKDMPDEFYVFKGRMYSSLAGAAYKKGKLPETKMYMEKALQAANHPMEKHFFQARLSQLNLIGSEAPSISAETWINSRPLTLTGLRGKIILIDFWAPWCTPCRKTLPMLTDLYQSYRKKNLVIIGYTKLYGMYRDDVEERNKVDKAEELALIEKFVRRNKIPYPISISHEGQDYAKYFVAGIPAMILIDKSGRVNHIQMGAGQAPFVRERILQLLQN